MSPIVKIDPIDGEVTITFTLSTTELADLLTFENSNKVVHALITSNPEAALAYYNELAYYADNNQI